MGALLAGSTMFGMAMIFGSGLTPAAAATPSGPLKVVKTIEVGGPARWDLLEADPATGRVYIANSDRVVVVDPDQGTTVGAVVNCPGVHGVALDAEHGRGYATGAGNDSVNVFDLKTLRSVGTVKTGSRPDAIVYDPATRKVFVMNGRGDSATIIDTTAPDAAPKTLALGGKPELAVADGAGHVYVNLEDKSQIVEIDSKADSVLAHWPLAPGEGPTGLAIDPKTHRLFADCGNGKMVILDAGTGKVVASPAIGRGVDGAAFDPGHGLAVAPNGGDGTVSVVREAAPDKFEVVQTLATEPRARTIACDAQRGRFFLPFRDAAHGGQLALLVVGPAE